MDDLKARLRQGGWADASGYRYNELPINPDGPEAADRIEKLEAALERLIEVADSTAWTVNTGMMDDAIEQARAALSDNGVAPAPSQELQIIKDQSHAG